MKILLKITKYLLIFVFLLILYGLATVVLSYIPVNKKQHLAEEQTITVYLLTNGVHTDLVLPFQSELYDWSFWLNPALTPGKTFQPQWVAFGWGDKGFYLQTPEWKDLKMNVALKAALGLSQSAMHVTYYHQMKANGLDCIEIQVTKKQFDILCAFISNSFDVENEEFILIDTDQNYGLDDVFYEAKGSYSIFYTCNTWTNDALKAAKLKASLFTLWDKGIFYHYTKK